MHACEAIRAALAVLLAFSSFSVFLRVGTATWSQFYLSFV